MNETVVCTDIALELLRWSLVSSNDTSIDAVRASKTFRSVNKTFRDAFDKDKTGSKFLSQYTSTVLKSVRRRTQGIQFLLKIHKRNQKYTHTSRTKQSSGWRSWRNRSSGTWTTTWGVPPRPHVRGRRHHRGHDHHAPHHATHRTTANTFRGHATDCRRAPGASALRRSASHPSAPPSGLSLYCCRSTAAMTTTDALGKEAGSGQTRAQT